MRQFTAWIAAICLISVLAVKTHGAESAAFEAVFAEDSAARQTAIETLRGEGPAALDRLFELRSDLQRVADSAADETKRSAANWSLRRVDQAIDRVGGQRYCTASRLYWYTDLAAAQAAAEQAGKPILSLRMLGNLTDEYSCANSRFFRTTLYANEDISHELRHRFILHWQSVRPVPVVTIDFGDGRKLKRTLTGNSAHYLLAADGQPIDVLPGLYHPQAFLEWLREAGQVARKYAAVNPSHRGALLRTYHRNQQEIAQRNWQNDLLKIGATLPAVDEPIPADAAPPAAAAALLAVTKGEVEVPILTRLALAKGTYHQLDVATDEDQWAKIAALHRGEVVLDDTSLAVIRAEMPAPKAAAAGARSRAKGRVEDPILRMVRALEDSIALDTIRNEYRLHSQIHDWFARDEVGVDVDALNERVYAELFLTPSSDPWLGLAPSDVYTALDNAGVVAKP